MAGLVLAAYGITPQTSQLLYPLVALLTGAIRVASALRVMDITRPACLLATGLGIWLFNVVSVLLGRQSFTGW
jgi:hypothetical protein